ncbi:MULTISPECIES: hypothetical protein [unclassified Xanthobacter]|uniref:hypothetical protein n=1 Tax=unclassified Xanthobacter TaxID=2623496 RepID=UPI001EDFCEB4|nr:MULTISPECIES: hypothetical protein [unclassified Xanthobacter]
MSVTVPSPAMVPPAARDGAPALPVRVVVFGGHSATWNQTLAAGGVAWSKVSGLVDVITIRGSHRPLPPPRDDLRTVVLPVMERHLLACPRDQHHGLLPQPHAVRTLADKSAFAAYVIREGLERYCPEIFASIEAARMPCTIKRLDLNSGTGVEMATSQAQLERFAARPPWAGFPVLLQAYVPHTQEYVTHAVCREGRILLHRTYRMTLKKDVLIRRPNCTQTCQSVTLTQAQLSMLESFLLPLRFSGPCNFDYVIREDGTVCVFEINPRLGGSLMAAQNQQDLADTLAAIVQHAEPLVEVDARLAM